MTAQGQSTPPPHNEEAESSVLGAALLADQWMDALVSDVSLAPEDFYRPRHQVIFAAMLDRHKRGEPIDTLTLCGELGNRVEDAGGRDYIDTLPTRIPSIANTKQYARIVKENSLLRQVLAATHSIQARVADRSEDPHELIEQAERLISDIGSGHERGGLRPIEDIMHERIAVIEDAGKRTADLLGVPSGLTDLDGMLDGFQRGKLYVIAGRPSMGKSALTSTIAPTAAEAGHPVAIFTMEMEDGEVAERLLAERGKFQGAHLRTGKLEGPAWSKLNSVAGELAELPIEIDDLASQTVAAIRSKVRSSSARRVARGQAPVGLVVIDYLQMIRPEDARMPRTYQVEEQTRALKRMARELNVPVILLSQLSREVERRSPPVPQLSDLKDSGAIEQDADCVILMYREDYYRSDSERPGEADLIVAKQRGGETGTVEVAFMPHYPAFKDLLGKPKRSPENAPLLPDFVAGRNDPGEQKEEVVF